MQTDVIPLERFRETLGKPDRATVECIRLSMHLDDYAKAIRPAGVVYAASSPADDFALMAVRDDVNAALRAGDEMGAIHGMLRMRAATMIEQLIALLDFLDGDADLEPSFCGVTVGGCTNGQDECEIVCEDEGAQCDDEGAPDDDGIADDDGLMWVRGLTYEARP